MANCSIRAAFFALHTRRQEKNLRKIKVVCEACPTRAPQESVPDLNLNKHRCRRLLSWRHDRQNSTRRSTRSPDETSKSTASPCVSAVCKSSPRAF
jgi:hypothetical protein